LRIGINGNRLVRPGNPEAIVEHASGVARDGFASYWLAQDPTGSCDALTALTLVATRVPEIELATGVVPTWPRHPAALAAQALTVNQASHGRLTLGIGLSHRTMMESVLGIPYEQPIRRMKDYLSILDHCWKRAPSVTRARAQAVIRRWIGSSRAARSSSWRRSAPGCSPWPGSMPAGRGRDLDRPEDDS
jgi:alkanesulfonate monooxygenase SsuD/methylene tetrahydromethanopterin reductase-like flavin-dependent oxidoreductase (luciferase family)